MGQSEETVTIQPCLTRLGRTSVGMCQAIRDAYGLNLRRAKLLDEAKRGMPYDFKPVPYAKAVEFRNAARRWGFIVVVPDALEILACEAPCEETADLAVA